MRKAATKRAKNSAAWTPLIFVEKTMQKIANSEKERIDKTVN